MSKSSRSVAVPDRNDCRDSSLAAKSRVPTPITTCFGKKNHGSVVVTLVERLTNCCSSVWLDGRAASAVVRVMETMKLEYGETFSQVFRSIMSDTGGEVADFSDRQAWKIKIFFVIGDVCSK